MSSRTEGTFKNKSGPLFLNSHSSKWHAEVLLVVTSEAQKPFYVAVLNRTLVWKWRKAFSHSKIVTRRVGPMEEYQVTSFQTGEAGEQADVWRPTMQMSFNCDCPWGGAWGQRGESKLIFGVSCAITAEDNMSFRTRETNLYSHSCCSIN